jgi:hypothetical protein
MQKCNISIIHHLLNKVNSRCFARECLP